MSINIGDNFSYLGKKFLDSRQSFDTIETMLSCTDVPIGFITFCKEDNKRYEYGQNGWVEYTQGEGISEEQKNQLNIAYTHSQSDHVTADEIADLASKEFVTDKIAEASLGGEGSDVDLSGYVSKEELEGKGYLTSIPEEYVTDEELNTKGYLTEHQDLSGYVSKEELEGKGYLTSIPEEYVTDEELNAKGYLTEHQDLSGYATKEYVDDAISNIDISGGGNVDIDLSDYVTNDKLQEGLANKFDNVEVNEVETNDNQTALDFYANGEVVKTVYFSGGGGGSATIPPYISTILPENSILGLGEVFDLQLDFSSSVTGRGTVKIFVNDVESISMSIPQGENTIPMADTYFTKGNNRVTVYVIDRTGQMSNSLTFYVRYGSLEITSDFDAYTAYEPGAVVRYYFTPTAVDTSLALTMYMKIDGEVKDGVTCSSDTRGYFTFPNNLEVGAHFCQAYVMDSAGSISNVLSFNFIVLDAVSLVVASDTINPIVEEGEQLSIDYKVYMRGATSFITKTYIDENLVNTGTCGLDFAYYRTSTLTEGIHTIKMEVYDVTETVSDYIIWTVTVTPSTYEMLQPVKAGSLFIGTAQNMTNSSENKEVWRGTDQDGAIVDGILHNFAFNSESGWVDDELLISGASSVEIPITPLANNARYGFTLDIEFASKMIGVDDALVLNLWDDEKDCGIKITTEQVILRSAEGNQADLYFTDSEMTSVIFVIDRNEATAKIYLNGVMCSAFHLSDYSIDGVPYLEDFTVNSTIMLGGSGHARIKNLRVYQVALSTDEILNNFMTNETRKAEQKALVEFQKGDHLPTLTIYCDFSGLGKDDKKPCAITYVSTDEEKYGKSFTLTHKKSTCQYQGTSSMAYPIKNYRLNLADEEGNKWKYDFPYGKPERRFTLKADFMSSGHWTNTGLTKWINNNLYNYNLDDEKTMNPKKWYDINNGGSIDDTRECIYGFPCRLILVNDGNTPLNEGQNEPTPGNTKDMGIFNFNHDKDATDTMGFDTDVFPNCASYEVTANSDTSAGAFMSYSTVNPSDMSELDYIKQSFELRFPDEDDVPEGWGFMGVASKILMIDVYSYNGSFNTAEISYDYFNTDSITVSFDNNSAFGITTTGGESRYNLSNGTTVSLQGASKFYLSAKDPNWTYIDINGVRYYKGEIIDNGIITSLKNPYEGDAMVDNSLGLKALIDWVDGCTDEEFVNEFEEHFNKDYTFRYFLLVITLGMVDNLGKNMMLDTWDNKIFMPRFYDCDTICSYDNSGQLKFDVDIEMAQGYWNTSSSRLWTRIRDLFHDELVAKYNNMRQNGLSYESLMECFYDEQIAKIPQRYYNMDYDVKYGPFADSYIGMANGDTYEHVKRWLQQRLRFVDTLYDYAPSYNNDVLTIRANTTEPMTLEIETYTPVYQHLSWYNNQMDKKKIDGKTSVSFTGTAMAATDQEVLIYGGSNIKSIKGISSMNPNRMLIGSATRLIELDAPNCPLLADINANKANLAPHVYLNKVNLSGCPLLGGNLIVNQSPLVREIDIRGTAITGLNLPPSLRNLEVLKLPAAISNLVLNDAGQLHTLIFENGVRLQNISMTNCNALVNVENFDMRSASSVTLNNSYSSLQELYFSNTTNVSLSNMPNIERVVYTPNDEYVVFDRNHLATKPNYKISVFNAPKCTEFIITAPQRLSYGLDDTEIKPDTVFAANSIDISNARFTDVKLLSTTDVNRLKLPNTVTNLIIDSAYDIDTDIITDANYDFIHDDLRDAYNTNYTNKVETSSGHTPDIIPSSSDGSLIYSINSDEDGVWNMNGILVDDLHIFGVNNDVKKVDDTLTMPDRVDGYGYIIDNLSLKGEVMRYTATTRNAFPTFNSDFEYKYTIESRNGEYLYRIIAKNNTLLTAMNCTNSTIQKTITSVKYLDTRNINDFSSMFNGCSALTSLDVSGFDTTNATNMSSMFQGCSALTSLDVSGFDTKNVTNMSNMFNGCSALTSLDVSGFDTKNVKNMGYMFSGCNALTSLDVSRFDTSNVTDMIYMFYACSSLTSLDLSNFNTSNVSKMDLIFHGCSSLTSLDLSSFNTQNVTYMAFMFTNCRALTSLDLSNFNVSKVTGMTAMFQNCDALMSLNVNGWPKNAYTQAAISSLPVGDDDMNKIYASARFSVPSGWDAIIALDILTYTTNASGVKPTFNNGYNAYSVKETDNGDGTYRVRINANDISNLPTSISFTGNTNLLTVEQMDTSEVTSMNSMFQGCSNLTFLDTSGFDTSKVTAMYSMFQGCSNLTSLDISGFDVLKVKGMDTMFQGCSKLTSLDVSGLDTKNVNSMVSMFLGCSALTSLDVSGFDTSNVTNMASMFNGCSSLTSLDVSGFDTSNVVSMNAMFQNCNALMSLNVTGWPKNDRTQAAISSLPVGDDATNEIYANARFSVPSGWNLIVSLDILIYTTNASGVKPTFNNGYNAYSVKETDNGDGTYRVRINANDISNLPTSISFANNANLLTVEKIDTSNVTNMSSMFNSCNNLTSLDGSSFDTSNVISMAYMFQSCKNLTSLDLSSFDTSNVTNMNGMFSGCNALTSLDVSSFDTSNVKDIGGMFQGCSSLTSLDISNFDTSNVTNMNYVFNGCNALTSLDLSSFDTSNVTSMNSMFYNCNNLTSLDLSGFDTSKVTNMGSMFQNCNALMSLDVTGWPKNNRTQAAISSLPAGNDAKNEIYATDSFTVPSGWSLINNASRSMSLRQTDLDNLTDEEIAALVDEGWTIG